MKQSTIALALLPLLFTPVTKARTPEMPVLENRAAQGDITAPGGARRLTGDQTAALRDSLSDKPAKNIILLIGDGMGDSEITAARNYAEGAGGFFKGIDALPLTGQYTHYALNKKTGKPDYVTDSAASATAWSTGVKTYNGALGVDIHEKDHPTILEMAKAAGLATGNVSTAELQDATPAALVAHVTSRKCYGPSATSEKCPGNALEKGGKGSITEQLLNARADVTLGGGAKTFAETATAGEWQGKTLREQAQARGYQLVSDAASLNAVTEVNQQKPLLGLFADGNMPVRWLGPKATYHGNIDKPAVTCTPNPQRNDSVPTLAQMTDKAIELLSKNEKGFFLQVEGASIDKQDHAAHLLYAGKHLFDALLKFAAVLAARDDLRHIQRVDPGVLEHRRHVAPRNPRSQSFCQRGFTHARFADEQRIVLRLLAQHTDHGVHLGFSADKRFQFAVCSRLRQVARILLQKLFFGNALFLLLLFRLLRSSNLLSGDRLA